MEAITRHMNRAMSIAEADLPEVPLDPVIQKVLDGDPRIRHLIIDKSPDGKVERGLWELSTGTITDEEYDEMFVIIKGRATVEFEGGPTIEIGPGDVGLLEDGARTIWRVHETIRKAYQITYTRPPRW
jgi:uncharacterized protein